MSKDGFEFSSCCSICGGCKSNLCKQMWSELWQEEIECLWFIHVDCTYALDMFVMWERLEQSAGEHRGTTAIIFHNITRKRNSDIWKVATYQQHFASRVCWLRSQPRPHLPLDMWHVSIQEEWGSLCFDCFHGFCCLMWRDDSVRVSWNTGRHEMRT